MWLTGRLVPDHKTIADFRKDNGPAIRKVCAQFVALCRRITGLLVGSLTEPDPGAACVLTRMIDARDPPRSNGKRG